MKSEKPGNNQNQEIRKTMKSEKPGNIQNQ